MSARLNLALRRVHWFGDACAFVAVASSSFASGCEYSIARASADASVDSSGGATLAADAAPVPRSGVARTVSDADSRVTAAVTGAIQLADLIRTTSRLAEGAAPEVRSDASAGLSNGCAPADALTSSDAGVGGADAAPPAACGEGTVLCATDGGGSFCSDEATDSANCGGCGITCDSGFACADAACELSCQPGFAACGGTCTNTLEDPLNCGSCDADCAFPANAIGFCLTGSCGWVCDLEYSDCGGSCVNEATDSANCGACGNSCGDAAPLCVEGECSAGWLRAQPWETASSSFPQLQSATSRAGLLDSEQFVYDDSMDGVYSAQTFTFEATATSTETVAFSWTYSGSHSYFEGHAELVAFAAGPEGTTTVTLVPSRLVDESFFFSGAASLEVKSGYTFGLIASGSNRDAENFLRGVIVVTKTAN